MTMRLAVLAVLVAGLCTGCSPSESAVAERGQAVRVGDVTVTPNRHVVRGASQLHSLSIDPSRDDRFRFSRPLKSISLRLHEEQNRRDLIERIGNATQAAPVLYEAPAGMTVLRNPEILGSAVIRVDGTRFFDKPLYVLCSTQGVRISAHDMVPAHAVRACSVQTQLTDKTFLNVVFDDYRYPASDWPELFASLEAGLKQAIAR